MKNFLKPAGTPRKDLFLLALLLLSTVLLFTSCGSDGPEEGSKGLLYQVEGGENQVYLFGTVHVGEEDLYPLHDNVQDAFQESTLLGLEIDMSEMSEMEIGETMVEYGMYQDGSRMTDIIPEETFDRVVEETAAVGVEGEILDQFNPWYATLILSEIGIEQSSLSPEYGIEAHLIEEADADMEIFSLETVSNQMEPYLELSDESQKIYLEQTLEELEHMEEDLNELIDHWKQGDKEGFGQLRDEQLENAETDSLKDFQLAMLDERDTAMTEKIDDILQSDSDDTYFIAVGSLHLAGENSIVDQLTELGYDVEFLY